MAFADFYRKMDYDAVGLSSSETSHGLTMWRDVAEQGLPVVAANIFESSSGKSFLSRIFGGNGEKPVFEQFIIREDHGQRLGVIGFLSPTAWKALPDSGAGLVYKSPFEMAKLVRKADRKCDHLTIVGEFTSAEADSLARAFPEVDVIISSAIRNDNAVTVGNTVIVGSTARGNNVNYVDLLPSSSDSLQYITKTLALDGSVPEDSTVARLLIDAKDRISSAGQQR